MKRVGLLETKAYGMTNSLTDAYDNRRCFAGALKLDRGLCSATDPSITARKPALYDEKGRYERIIHVGRSLPLLE